MTKAFVFAGNDTVGNMVADRLCGAGWQRVGDAGAADAVITYFTAQNALEDAYFGDNGIVQGGAPLPDGSANFMWQDMMTREQLVTVLYRFAQKLGMI